MAKTSTLEDTRSAAPAGLADACPSDCALVYLCRKCKGSEAVAGYLRRETPATVTTVRCQKVCESPVAGLEVDGRMEWFERADGPKALNALALLASGRAPGQLPKCLKKRRSKKRSGRAPR